MKAFRVLEGIGIKEVNLLGGEPTLFSGLPELIEDLNNTSLEYVLISNSLFSENLLCQLVDSGLKGYIASVDELVLTPDCKDSALIKSFAGLRALEVFRKKGVKFLGANIVIHRNNITKIIPTVKYLMLRGFYVNVCPIIWGTANHWERRQRDNDTLSLKEALFPILKEISEYLIEVKHNCDLILSSESYLRNLPEFSIRLNWKCYNENKRSIPPRLRIDADGALMSCPDFRGSVSRKYHVWDLPDSKKLHNFFLDWHEDVKGCPGCYWSSMYHAKEDLDGTEDSLLHNLRPLKNHTLLSFCGSEATEVAPKADSSLAKIS